MFISRCSRTECRLFLEFCPLYSSKTQVSPLSVRAFKLRRRHSHGRSILRIGLPRKIVLFVVGLVFGVVVWFMPSLLLNSPLKDQLLGTVTDGLDGRVSIGWVSAGWLSPIVARDLVWLDSDGELVLEAESVGTDRSLGSLLMDRQQLGHVRIGRLRLKLVSRSDGSNLEDAVQPWFDRPSQSTSPVTCTVEIVDGQIDVSDHVSNKAWSVTRVNAVFDTLGLSTGAINGKLAAEVISQQGSLGSLTAELQSNRIPAREANRTGVASLQTTQVPLPLVEAALRRFQPDLRLDGALNGRVTAKWGNGQASLQLEEVVVNGFSLAAPTYLGSDRLTSDTVRVHGGVSNSGSNWQVDAVTLESDLVNCQLSGKGTWPSAAAGQQSLADAWKHGSYQLGGTVELARLAQTLPNTLRIRKGTYVSSGRVTFALFGKPQRDGQTWEGRLETSRLAGMHQEKPLIWDKPVEVTLKAKREADEIQVQQLTCRASFLEIVAQGTARRGSVVADGDLNRFAAEMERFFNLGDLSLAGQLHADLQWQQDAEGHVGVDGTASATGFEFTAAAAQPWREQLLEIKISAEALAGRGGLQSLDQATLVLDSQGDHFEAELSAPVAPVARSGEWPFSLQLTGNLQTWLPRLRGFIELPGVNPRGAVTLNAEAVMTGDRLEIRNGKLRAVDLQLQGEGFSIREPAVEVVSTATWHADRRELFSKTTTFTSSSLAVRADDVRATFAPQGASISGNLGYRGDLERLCAWFEDDRQPSNQRISGEAIGRVTLAYESGITIADWTTEVTDLLIARRAPSAGATLAQASAGEAWRTTWAEPRVEVEGQARYDHSRDQIELDRFQVASESISLGAQGKLNHPGARCEADLQGQVSYDLQRLSLALKDQFGDSLQLVGRDSRPFILQGPLFAAASPAREPPFQAVSAGGALPEVPRSVLAEIIAQASLAWTSANIQGFVIGPGELQTRLSGGLVQIAPLDLPVSEGRLRLESSLDLTGETPILSVPKASLDQVRVAPDMCQTWLKYVAPLVADATAAEGTFSLTVDNATIPLNQPQAGALHGTLTVHSARIGAGPMTREFLWLAQQVKALLDRRPMSAEYQGSSEWMVLPEQEFTFQLADQRFYHRDLQLKIQGVTMRTTGSVGMDQTLALMAEVPIQDEWLGTDRQLASLRGKVLKIPIQGTLSQPRLDRGALKQLSAQLLTETATGAASQLLEREIGRGLDRLFGPPRN